jgi:hypothetical protein
MIVSLVKETCELIREVEARQQAKNVLESVNETFSMLTTLNENVTQLRDILQLLRTRLSPAEINAVVEIGMRCGIQLNQSAERFLLHPRQKSELQGVQTQLQKAWDLLKKTWGAYVERRIHEPLKLYLLVAELPGIKESKAVYDDVQNRLAITQKTLPTTQNHLDDFDRTVTQFKHMLLEIGELSEAVKTFLDKIANGTASLDDVTDEVLQWCCQGQRSKVFSVQITH